MQVACTEEEVAVTFGGQTRPALVRTPWRLAERPALLISLAADRRAALEGAYFRIAPDIFLAAGHRVASFDLPCHGDSPAPFGPGLEGWAKAFLQGADPLEEVRKVGSALIDLALASGWANAGEIAVAGTSRGGLAALHLMAADRRVLACAVEAPVTHLPALREFAGLGDNEVVRRSNALSLADRPVFIGIGTGDPRVGAEHCFAFFAALTAASSQVRPVLSTGPGNSHGDTFPAEVSHQAGAAFLLGACARRQIVEPRSGPLR